MPQSCRLKGTASRRASMRLARDCAWAGRAGRTGKAGRKLRRAAIARLLNAIPPFPSFPPFPLIIRHPRIHSRIEYVGEQVHDHEDQAEKENAPLYRGEVTLVDRVEDIAPHSGPGKNRLGQDRSGEIAAEVE